MDRTKALATLTKEGYKLRDMPQYMDDKDLVLAAVKDYGLSLKHASPELQNNRQVVMAAVKNNGMAIDFASPVLKTDKAIIKAAKAQEKALDDKMKKQYPMKSKSKGGTRKNKTRKMRGGFRLIRDELLDELYSYMATEMRKPIFLPHVPKTDEMFDREVRLLSAVRIQMLLHHDTLNRKKDTVIKYILDEQRNQATIDATASLAKITKNLIKLQDVYTKSEDIRHPQYRFVSHFPDAKIIELIEQVSRKLE